MEWPAAILTFWFGLPSAWHWRRDPALDAEIESRFGKLWEEQRSLAPPAKAGALGEGRNAARGPGFRRDDGGGRFLETPDVALAAVILFDQFPRNLFRDDRRAFATDPLARQIATGAIERGYDEALPHERRAFLYMPFQHSEKLPDQERSLRLFRALGDDEKCDFAQKHHSVIARFGRFPHRNAVLGRESTPAEEAFDMEPAW